MGALCEDAHEERLGQLQIALNLSTKKDYQAVPIQELPYLQTRIQQLVKNNPDFHSFAEGKQLLKQKDKNVYYFGEWNANGYPKGKGIQYKVDQYIYYGDFDSVPSGKGTYESLKNRYIYQGELKYGQIEGQGKMQSTQNLYCYQGIFNKDGHLITGTAVINNLEDQSTSYTVVLNNYPETKAKIINKDGRQYQGEISYLNYAPHGRGTAKFLNSSGYEGAWQNGEYHGQGKFIWADGSSYEGNYQHGKKKGQGTFIYASKKYYKGNWENGVQNGEGTLFDKEGNVLKKGVWKEGKFEKKAEQ